MENSLNNEENFANAHHLWTTINQIHMCYLELDEGSDKIDQRTKLEARIEDFLCLVSHDQKFTLPETYEVFHRSVANKKDFSGYKAATGWNTIQMYAGNLLSQPWRKEYYQIKGYCGFYKHQVKANLTGSEKMFEAMGYKQKGDDVLLLDVPICPDRLANVSRDCIFAYVECQILKRIWEEISPLHNISWLDILDFRYNHICNIDQCVKALKALWNQKKGLRVGLPSVNSFKFNSPSLPKNQTSQKFALLSAIPSMNYKASYDLMYPNTSSVNHQIPIPISSNGYYYSNSNCANKSSYQVPTEIRTAEIVELDKPTNGLQYNIPYSGKSLDSYENPKARYDDWGYVYKNLENQGYSKDLGERGDILNLNPNHKSNIDPKQQSQSVQVEKGRIKTPNKATVSEDPASIKNKWECPACTFMNTKADNIVCEMCSKSRYPAKQDPPMEIGGAECSKCTLVNPKNTKLCMACSSSLENSPTYI